MPDSDRTIEGATSLLKEILPDLIDVACFWATSENVEAVRARDTLKQNARRPFHTFLYQYLGKLHHELLRVPVRLTKTNDKTLHQALARTLSIFEDEVIVSSRAFGLISWSWFSRDKQHERTHGNVLHWAARSRCHDEDKLLWLIKNTRLAAPPEQVRTNLLDTVASCASQIEKLLPVYAVPFEDEEFASISAEQRAAWRKVEEMCKGVEHIHRQLSSAWRCSCSNPHEALHFAINPYSSREDGTISSAVLHDSSGWKRTAMLMKYAQHGNANYDEFCQDLNASTADRPWYTISNCASCMQPMTFDQLEMRLQSRPLPKERLCLAVILSHLYLHLSGGAWWPYTRTDAFIRFDGPERSSLSPLSTPFLPFSTCMEFQPDVRFGFVNPSMPSLVQFGKLLLEIILWESCSWEGNAFEESLRKLRCESDLANVDRILVAIIACTGYKGEDRLRAKACDQTIRNSERMRMEFLTVVIQNLEYVLRVAYQIDANMLFSLPERNVAPRREPTNDDERRRDARNDALEAVIALELAQMGRPAVKPMDHAVIPDIEFVLNDDTGEEQSIESREVTEADLWNQRLLPLKGLILPQNAVVTKVAVLDTGLHFDADIADLYDDRAEAYCFLENDAIPSQVGAGSPAPLRFDGDEDGHGTHMCSIVLDVGTNCKVYSGRIARTREDIRGKKSRQEIAARIARAIKHAVDIWKVDIISMSFGFVIKSKAVSEAIKYAHDHQVLLFAAAGNNGSTEKVRYPARDPNVLCIHAATGFGNMYNGNPTKKDNTSNFALLGVALEGFTPQMPAKVRRSGTSQATAVAAGVAALIIQIMRDSKGEVRRMGWTAQRYESALSQLKELEGMRRVFEKMSTQRNEYEVVTPWSLLDGMGAVERSMLSGHICHTIMTLMEDYDDDE